MNHNQAQILQQIPPDSWKPVVCTSCGCPVFIKKQLMQFYKGILAPGPIMRHQDMLVCDNCGLPFDPENVKTVNNPNEVKITHGRMSEALPQPLTHETTDQRTT